MKNSIQVFSLNLTDYKQTWDLQKQIFSLVEGKAIDDALILNEHEHVYTIGKSGDDNHLLASEKDLELNGVKVYHIDRGGDITYHGPGQLVGYPILNLERYYLDIHRYLRDLEEVLILTLHDFGIEGKRNNDFTGVWVGENKIAAIGVKVSKWITMHGFAFNVNTDLSYFERIIPCGIFHKGVTSMEKLLGKKIAIKEVEASVIKNFEKVFHTETVVKNINEFNLELQKQSQEIVHAYN
ncbi:MAG: lipoyl(octanoyl) transferase LipB [Ignavibacteriales bacterium]|nr:lipoyl(octanoyl) transferase LipB [Ignavibacteriales bacterium]